jgi:plastocyanin
MRVLLASIVLALTPAFAAGASAAQYVVEINDLRFGAAPSALQIGDTITWKNSDIVRHTATARNGIFDLILEPGTSKAVTLEKTGHVTVYCRYHPDMVMQLTISK